jgi:hypothetical protein
MADGSESAVSHGEAGAPEARIEVTPAMVVAGVRAFCGYDPLVESNCELPPDFIRLCVDGLLRALKSNNPEALVDGPDGVFGSVIDGEFDLESVLRDFLSRVPELPDHNQL